MKRSGEKIKTFGTLEELDREFGPDWAERIDYESVDGPGQQFYFCFRPKSPGKRKLHAAKARRAKRPCPRKSRSH